ncbi:MAG: hypothetical protein RIQ61_1528, partial [Bacteroidota bacterium]
MSFSNSIATLTLLLSFSIGKQSIYAAPKKILLKKDTQLLVFEANTQTTF